jgi:hypothetical protein
VNKGYSSGFCKLKVEWQNIEGKSIVKTKYIMSIQDSSIRDAEKRRRDYKTKRKQRTKYKRVQKSVNKYTTYFIQKITQNFGLLLSSIG